jgi:hypothetical protein
MARWTVVQGIIKVKDLRQSQRLEIGEPLKAVLLEAYFWVAA